MKGLRVLMVASAFVALAPSAQAVTKAAPEVIAELGRAVAAGTAIESATAIRQLVQAGFDAGAARAVLRTLTAAGNKAKVSGIDWDRFAAAAKEKQLSVNALSSLIAKIDSLPNGTAFTAELAAIQATATTSFVAGPATAQDPEVVFQTYVSPIGWVNEGLQKWKDDDSEVARKARIAIGEALVLATTTFPETCSPGKAAECRVAAERVTGKWGALGYPARGEGAVAFYTGKTAGGGVLNAFNKSYPGEVVIAGTERYLDSDKSNAQLNACFGGVTVNR
jgi:hypothetical protein